MSGSVLHIYNTQTGRSSAFEPLDPAEVKMYVCGPTVYGPAHIGHASTYIVFDVVRRYLEYKGYTVRHVQNFTDVDDKIIARARETGMRWDELSSTCSQAFLEEMDRLNVNWADEYPRASGVIEDIVRDIGQLVEHDHAYPLDGDVYFRVLSDPDYGKLSHRKLDEMRAGARVESDSRKEHPTDFALWKAAKPGEPSWASPWGPGRPGWHIECTSMILQTLGEQIDIHGGGADLIFPHHENETAQSEKLTGKEPFARYWMHKGMLQLGGEKMSRSVGNIVSLGEALDRYGPDAIRLFVLSTHYRKPLNYSDEALRGERTAAGRLAMAAQTSVTSSPPRDACAAQRQAFESAMDDDFNTASAIAVLFELSSQVNRLQAEGQDASVEGTVLRELGGVLGLRLERPSSAGHDAEPFVELLVEVRAELRAAKQWTLSDRVRDGLRELGIALEDTPQGTKWRVEG